ncbi:hypothetical protein HYW46_03080 [Candidatus Daviesbacteria bacterium]|nr:hypothetical protein [Candidatus Daviesbacteria bacterium]
MDRKKKEIFVALEEFRRLTGWKIPDDLKLEVLKERFKAIAKKYEKN